MDTEEKRPQKETEYINPGQQWAQRLGLVGGIVVLLFSLVFVLTMLTDGPEHLDYTPSYETDYYTQHLDVLQTELEQQVLPHVEGVEDVEIKDGKIVVGIRSKYYLDTRAVIIDLFDQSLFVFEQR